MVGDFLGRFQHLPLHTGPGGTCSVQNTKVAHLSQSLKKGRQTVTNGVANHSIRTFKNWTPVACEVDPTKENSALYYIKKQRPSCRCLQGAVQVLTETAVLASGLTVGLPKNDEENPHKAKQQSKDEAECKGHHHIWIQRIWIYFSSKVETEHEYETELYLYTSTINVLCALQSS